MFIIIDVGSTTTKALLVDDSSVNRWSFLAEADTYTTVEEPYEDVNIGITKAIKALEQKSNKTLLDNNDNCLQTLLVTSSAGGGYVTVRARAVVDKVYSSGLVYMKEKQDCNRDKVSYIDVAKKINYSKKYISRNDYQNVER